ncbi:hypothetical protein AMYBAR_004110 [Amycolatopsis bartoniae]|uniref:Uncharacterized protein n=1 Tax=Amycolatopsis bartoniae TaxID=941986 RepID=A0A8H9IW35_9PSEU|nr:hypothetical protein [Amycolatopsis bartoniae]TVS99398.1 hypothetical protein FNH07_34960 [Amycolatopsis bartoniae]GHF37177.1 hypothetical protein GCM10017566_07910 [Amycolatopsis bartoniae]
MTASVPSTIRRPRYGAVAELRGRGKAEALTIAAIHAISAEVPSIPTSRVLSGYIWSLTSGPNLHLASGTPWELRDSFNRWRMR